jgi:DNA-binding PadR family transcriptional regulator
MAHPDRDAPYSSFFSVCSLSHSGLGFFGSAKHTEKQVAKCDFFAIIELMTERSYLGEFELMILLTVIHLGDEAYGVPISRELEVRRGRDVSVGSVYAALERLEGKGLVESSLGDPTPERGGKAKRFFRITKEGLRQVHETRRVLTRLWRTIPELKLESFPESG